MLLAGVGAPGAGRPQAGQPGGSQQLLPLPQPGPAARSVAAEIARDRVRQALAGDPALAARLLDEGTPYNTAQEILDRKP